MNRLLLLVLLTALLSLDAWPQQRTTVGGTVVSGVTGQALAGVSVSGGGQTVVTNDDGYFLLKSDTPMSSIVVSHVGYRSVKVEGERLKVEGGLRIRLQPAEIQLGEVLVVAIDARELVDEAVRKIPQNYGQRPELFHCFYRETVMKRQRYIMVSEGVVDMYKTSYKNVVLPVQLDMVKVRDVLLNKDDLDCYDMTMEPSTTISDRSQYVVSIKPRCVMPYALYYGKLYIDQETLAFTRIELSLDMSDREKATQMMLVKKPWGVRFRPKELLLLIDYRTDGDVTRMSYVRTTFRFNCDWRRRLFATSFTACCEMAVTSHDAEEAQPISGRESFDQRDAFYDKVEFFRDSTFWQNYNIIEPTVSLDRAVDRLLKSR